MSEIIFEVQEDGVDGGYAPGTRPKMSRLHFVRDVVMAA